MGVAVVKRARISKSKSTRFGTRSVARRASFRYFTCSPLLPIPPLCILSEGTEQKTSGSHPLKGKQTNLPKKYMRIFFFNIDLTQISRGREAARGIAFTVSREPKDIRRLYANTDKIYIRHPSGKTNTCKSDQITAWRPKGRITQLAVNMT